MKKILFVCTGNKFRSKLEEALVDKYFPDIEVDSCGIGSKQYDKISPLKLRKLSKELFKLEEDVFLKRSKEIDKKLFNWADIVVVQQKSHFKKIEERFIDLDSSDGEYSYNGKLFYLHEFCETKKWNKIPDLAFVSNELEYKSIMKEIKRCVFNLIERECL